MEPIPTVDDLRVKRCFVCLQEERSERKLSLALPPMTRLDIPSSPKPSSKRNSRNTWVHPCKCNVVAHRACLLQVIVRMRSSNQPAKCTVCGYTYELSLVPSKPRQAMNKMSWVLDKCIFSPIGMWGFGMGVGVPAVFGLGTSLAAYGIFKFSQVFGDELTDVIMSGPDDFRPEILTTMTLTDPFHGLAFSRCWHSWSPSFNMRRQLLRNLPHRPSASMTYRRVWPLPPLVMGIVIFPHVRGVYRYWFDRFRYWVLGLKQKNFWLIPPAEDTEEEPEVEVNDDPDNIWAMDDWTFINTSLSQCLGSVLFPVAGAMLGDWLGSFKAFRAILPVGPSLKELGLPGFVKPTLGDESYWEMYLNWVLQESDARWFRAVTGHAVLVVAFDLVNLLYKKLKKIQLSTTRIKGKDFAGVPLESLDIIPR